MAKANNAEWTVDVADADTGAPVACRVVPTPERARGWRARGVPQWEIIAPDGCGFLDGCHALVCFDVADVRERAENSEVTRCGADCECGGIGGAAACGDIRAFIGTVVAAVDRAAAGN